jgi:hypothetical protein
LFKIQAICEIIAILQFLIALSSLVSAPAFAIDLPLNPSLPGCVSNGAMKG